MSSYLKSEFYRVIHSSWTYAFVAICSFLLLSSNVLLATMNSIDSNFLYGNTKFAYGNVYTSLGIVLILCIAVSNMVFGNEIGNHTLKNTISYGISRKSIFLGKLIVQVIYAAISLIIILTIYSISTELLLDSSGSAEFIRMLRACAAAFPLLVAGLTITNCFVFNMKSSGSVITAFIIMAAVPFVVNILAMKFELFQTLAKYIPLNILNDGFFDEQTHTVKLYWDTTSGFITCWIVGIVWTLAFIIIGYSAFSKKEIK